MFLRILDYFEVSSEFRYFFEVLFFLFAMSLFLLVILFCLYKLQVLFLNWLLGFGVTYLARLILIVSLVIAFVLIIILDFYKIYSKLREKLKVLFLYLVLCLFIVIIVIYLSKIVSFF
jgi:hypothetical protein